MQQIWEGMKACDDSANSMSQLPFIYFSFLATNQVDEGEKKMESNQKFLAIIARGRIKKEAWEDLSWQSDYWKKNGLRECVCVCVVLLVCLPFFLLQWMPFTHSFDFFPKQPSLAEYLNFKML